MYIEFWKWFFVAGVAASAVAVYDPELPVTAYASLLALFIWGLLGWGASNPVAISQGTTVTAPGSMAVVLICWLNALVSGLVPLVLALWDWIEKRRGSIPEETTEVTRNV